MTAYHWHEYPVGRLGGLATALARTLAAFAVGLGVTTGAILVVGMLKDNVIHDLASHWGADTDALSAGIDDLLRMSIGPLVGIGYLVALATCVAVLVRDTAISRAVVQAARDGATKEAVPTPYQIRSIIADSFALQWFALWSAIIGAVVFLPFGIYAVVDAYAPGILIAVCALIWAAIMVAVFLVVRRRTVPAHDRRRQSIASHWIYEDEHAVWQRAAGPSESDADRDWRARVGRGLTGMGATIGLAAALVLLLVLFVTHPHARTLPGSAHAGPEVTYTGLMGHGVDTARWVVAALCVAALLVTLVGMLLEGAGAAAERAMLARAARPVGQDATAVRAVASYPMASGAPRSARRGPCRSGPHGRHRRSAARHDTHAGLPRKRRRVRRLRRACRAPDRVRPRRLRRGPRVERGDPLPRAGAAQPSALAVADRTGHPHRQRREGASRSDRSRAHTQTAHSAVGRTVGALR